MEPLMQNKEQYKKLLHNHIKQTTILPKRENFLSL
jgi:hypothetical protein